MGVLKKWLSSVLAATMIFSAAASVVSADPTDPPEAPTGAAYFQGTDNAGQDGIGGADGDLDADIYNHLKSSGGSPNHPIEFFVDTSDYPDEINNAVLLIRARDVDEEDGEWDRVFFGEGSEAGKQIREIGNLTGNNEVWNTTAFYLDPGMVKKGKNYIEIFLDDLDGTKDYNWKVKVDWGQIVINGGPKDQIAIDRTPGNQPTVKVGTDPKFREVAFHVISDHPGTYIAEINLLDADGNNIGTIFKEIEVTSEVTTQQIEVIFDNGNHYGQGNSNPIEAGKPYSANIIIYTEDELDTEPDAEFSPGEAQDIWSSNTPPVVRDMDKGDVSQQVGAVFATSDFTGKFINLNDETDPLAKIKLTNLPNNGDFYLVGSDSPIVPVNGAIELDASQLEGLTFKPDDGALGSIEFQWNGYDGQIYALFPATVTLNVVPAPVFAKAEIMDETPNQLKVTFNEPINVTVGDAVYGGFSVAIDGDPDLPVTVTGSTYGGDGSSVILFLENPVPQGVTVLVSYDSSMGDVQATDDNTPAISFVNKPVTRVHKPLDGWVGSRAATDTNDVFVAPGDPLKLSAISSVTATRVTAEPIDGKGPADLVLKETYPGYKVWELVTYRLPDDAAAGPKSAEFASYEGDSPLPAETADVLVNNEFYVVTRIDLSGIVTETDGTTPIEGAAVTLYDAAGSAVMKLEGQPITTVTDETGYYAFDNIPAGNIQIVVGKESYGTNKRVIRALPSTVGQTELTEDFELAPFSIRLTANPSSIVGDGTSFSYLTAEILDEQGEPMPNTEVEFNAPAGTFENGTGSITATTDVQGKATVKYTSAVIEGIITQNVPVTAKVDDGAGLKGEAQIVISFQPARIKGVITNTVDGAPVAAEGAVVRVTKDFDGDGIIDFSAEALTDSDGHYSIAVPRGGPDIVYDVEITKQVEMKVGNAVQQVPVTFKQKAPVEEVLDGTDQEFKSAKTITGIIGLGAKEDRGQLELLDNGESGTHEMRDGLRVYLKEAGGGYIMDGGVPKAFLLEDVGVFNAEGVEAGKTYEVEIKYVLPGTGGEILMNRNPEDDSLPKITISDDGEMNIAEMLVDPYGTITDGNTGEVIEGATVTLYYADTGEEVTTLPPIPGFEPNDNANPVQFSDENGLYAYMVFPETDYYLTVTKEGYHSYRSDTIKVDWDIVKHDVQLYRPSSSGGGSAVSTEPDVTLNLSVDKNLVEEGGQSKITVAYKNESVWSLDAGDITLTLPEGVAIIDADDGAVDGRTITWTVEKLASKASGKFEIVVKWPQLERKDASFEVSGVFIVSDKPEDAAAAHAAVEVKVFSNRFGELSHQRYIIGFPDGQFKPNRSLTRAELAAIVARLTENDDLQAALPFTDVPSGHWAANYIKIATKHGYFSGFADGTFRPDQEVTRAELASVMARFLKLQVSKPGDWHFNDIEGHWAANVIEDLYRSKFVSGYPDGSFKPNHSIIRSEAVSLINRMLYRGPLQGLKQMFPDMPASHWAFGHVQEATQSHESERNSDGGESWIQALADDVQ